MRGSLSSAGIRLGLSRVMGGSPSGDSTTATDVEFTGNIIITFSEAVDPLTVTNVGDGSGSMEFSDSGGFIAGVLSTSDNIQYTFNPTANLTIGDQVTATLTSAIESAVGAVPYAGPFTILFNPVDTTAPAMTGFTCEASSVDQNIAILTLSATDADAVDSYQINENPIAPSASAGTWKSSAAWITDGYDVTSDGNKTLYAWAKDSSGNVSTSLSDECNVGAPPASLIAAWEFNDSDATDSIGTNDFTTSGVAYTDTGGGDIALDTQAAGYAQNTAIDSALDDLTVGTIDMVIARTDITVSQSMVFTFSQNGSTGDEILITLRGNGVAGGFDDTVNLLVLDGGTSKISYFSPKDSIPLVADEFFRLTVSANGSGVDTGGYSIYINDVFQTPTKSKDEFGYRGLLPGDALMSGIDTLSLGALLRASNVVTAETKYKYVRIYNERYTPAEIDAL